MNARATIFLTCLACICVVRAAGEELASIKAFGVEYRQNGHVFAVQFFHRPSDEAIRLLKELRYLKSLDISHKRTREVGATEALVTPEQLKVIGQLSGLRDLNVAGNYFGNIAFTSLAPLTTLESLDLSRTDVTDSDLPMTGGMRVLRSLKLENTRITSDCWKHIASLNRLESLQLSGTQVSDVFFQRMRAGGELSHLQLKELALRGTEISDASMHSLQGMVSLNRLAIPHTSVGDKGVLALAHLSALRELDLSHTKITSGCGATLTKLQSLESLDLGSIRMEGEQLFVALSATRTLRRLSLANTPVTSDGLGHLSSLMVERLDLDGCGISDVAVDQIAKMKCLTTLMLGNNPISDEGLAKLLELPHLSSLFLGRTLITATAIKEFKTKRPGVQVYN